MSLLKGIAVSVMWVISSTAFAADVYVCEKNGRKEFSQLPCGDNAVILKTEGDPNSFSISIPMKPKEIDALCRLVIRAKDISLKSQRKYIPPIRNYNRRNYNRRNYNYDYNYNYNYESANTRSNRNTPETYVLSHISNLEQIATKSPSLYQTIKSLVSHVEYHGYEESPIYESERAAALSNCQESLSGQMADSDR